MPIAKIVQSSPMVLLSLFLISETNATTYYWDGSQSTHWGRAKNWNSGGAGGFPNATNAETWLVYNGYPNAGGQGVGSGKMTLSLDDNDTSTVNFSTGVLRISTNDSGHDWVLNNGSSTGTIKVYSDLIFDLNGGGSVVINSDLEMGDNSVDLHGKGSRVTLNGQLIGGSSAVLDATSTYTPSGQSSISGGGLKLTASTNDSFTGKIKTGLQKVEVTQVNGLRNATIEISNVADSFIWPSNAVIGALTGTYALELKNDLKVGYKNSNFTYGGQFSGSNKLYKIGSGVMTLSNSSTHTGRTEIDAGSIKLTNGNALEKSPVWLDVNNGLNVNGLNATIAGLGGTGSLDLGSTTLNIEGSGDITYLGNVSGSGILSVNRADTQTFGSSATFSGVIHLLDGTLESYGGTMMSSGSMFVGDARFLATDTFTSGRTWDFPYADDNATIEVADGETLTWSGELNGNSEYLVLTKEGSGSLALTNNSNGFEGALDITEGLVRTTSTALANTTVNVAVDGGITFSDNNITLGQLSGSGDIILGSGKVLTFGGNDRNGIYSGNISSSGSAAFHKEGAGEFQFSGTYNGTGATNLNGGVFILDGSLNSSMMRSIIGVTGTSVEGQGRMASKIDTAGDISPDEVGVDNTGTIHSGSLFLDGRYYCDIDVTNNQSDKLKTNGVMDIEDATLDLNFQGITPTHDAYVIAEYGSISGARIFQGINNLPAGYKMDYAYSGGTSIAVVKDSTAPVVNSIVKASGVSSPTNANGVSFDVTFSEEVFNVTQNDFLISFSGTKGTAVLSGDGANYTMTVPSLTGNGTLSISVKSANDIKDEAQHGLSTSAVSASVVIDNTAPAISLTGATSLNHEYGTNWTDPGYSATDTLDGAVSVQLSGATVSSSSSLRTYVIKYDASDSAGNNATQQTRTVTVVDTAKPVLNLINSASMEVEYGSTWNDPGAYSVDNYDGVLSVVTSGDTVDTSTLGVYTIYYNATDSSSNAALQKSRAVTVSDTIKPVITLTGSTNVDHENGVSWSDPGYMASDNYDGSVTVIVSGDTVDSSTAGDYTIYYDATDSSGNTAVQKSRVVTVAEPNDPIAGWLESFGLTGDDALPSADPDGDGLSNREEFALDGTPNNAVNDGKLEGEIAEVSTLEYLTLSFPVRLGANFSGVTYQSASIDGVTYTVSGSTDLNSFNMSVSEVTPALKSSPSLTEGWEYRSFRVPNTTDIDAEAFMKIEVTEASN